MIRIGGGVAFDLADRPSPYVAALDGETARAGVAAGEIVLNPQAAGTDNHGAYCTPARNRPTPEACETEVPMYTPKPTVEAETRRTGVPLKRTCRFGRSCRPRAFFGVCTTAAQTLLIRSPRSRRWRPKSVCMSRSTRTSTTWRSWACSIALRWRARARGTPVCRLGPRA